MPARVALRRPAPGAHSGDRSPGRSTTAGHARSSHGHQLTMVARMARLTTGFAATLDAPSPQTLRPARPSDEGGLDVVVDLTKRELAFEIGNPLRLFVELFAQAVVLALRVQSRASDQRPPGPYRHRFLSSAALTPRNYSG